MRATLRAAALIAACLLLPVGTALAAPATEAAEASSSAAVQTAAAADEYTDTFYVTLDWTGQRRVVLPPTAAYWSWDQLPDGLREYYRIASDSPNPVIGDTGFQVYVELSGGYTLAPWEAPPSFEFTFWENIPGVATVPYRVVVDVINIPTEPRPPNPEDIDLPTITDATYAEDIGMLLDGGHPLAGTHHVEGWGSFNIGETITGDRGNGAGDWATSAAKPLNPEMAKYFTLVSYHKELGAVVGLKAAPDAPALPAQYWTKAWFTVEYTVSGEQQDAEGWGVVRPYSVDRKVIFGEPAYQLGARSATLRYYPKQGATSWLSVSPAQRQASGLVAGSLRVHLSEVPASVSRRFEMLVANPRYATAERGPRVGIRPRSTKAARNAAPFTLQYRISAVNRAGERVYSAPATVTFKH